MNGDLFPLKAAFGAYMARWYATLYGDTAATQEFAQRGSAKSIKMAPGRMVDDFESMFASYQRDQQGPRGANSLLPVVIFAMARDYNTTLADWAGRQMPRRLVCFESGEDASFYGYRQAMHDTRVQVAIVAAEEGSARSLAAQFGLFVGDPANRRFFSTHEFGQYSVQMPVMVENPDVAFAVAGQSKTMTVLVGELTLKAIVPYFDAPKPGEPNDGSDHNPPGYPGVAAVTVEQFTPAVVTDEGTDWGANVDADL